MDQQKHDTQPSRLETYHTILRDIYNIYEDKLLTHQPDEKEYKASQYVIDKLDTWMKQLGDEMDVYYQSFEKREEYKSYIETTQREYIDAFLKTPSHQLFYIPKTDIYIKYDGNKCEIINENSICFQLLSRLTDATHPLFSRRYLVKKQVLSHIKQRNLFGTTPTTHTIQRVLSLFYPTFIDSKDSVKYFLTVLGDILLKKNNYIYLVDQTSKAFIQALEEHIYFYWANTTSMDAFKYKYYDHDYDQCRLLRFNQNIQQNGVWEHFLKASIIDIVMVATHYSERYGSADKFLETTYDEELRDHALYLTTHTKEDVFKHFTSTYLTKTDASLTKIKWVNMQYLWRLYIEQMGLPSIIMSQQLKDLFHNSEFEFDGTEFTGISSKYLQRVQDFDAFWNDALEHDPDDQLEISELVIAYHQWAKQQRSTGKSISKLTDVMMYSYIKYFHSEYEMENRIVKGISCRLWKRNITIESIFNSIIKEMPSNADGSGNSSSHWTDIYEEMTKVWVVEFGPPISMNYFRRWLDQHQYGEWIQ